MIHWGNTYPYLMYQTSLEITFVQTLHWTFDFRAAFMAVSLKLYRKGLINAFVMWRKTKISTSTIYVILYIIHSPVRAYMASKLFGSQHITNDKMSNAINTTPFWFPCLEIFAEFHVDLIWLVTCCLCFENLSFLCDFYTFIRVFVKKWVDILDY